MEYRPLGFALIALAIVLILFDVFFRYRFVVAGDRVWRIDRVTDQACIVSVGDAICSTSLSSGRRTVRVTNPYLSSPTPEPNPR
ncbi:MAG: hypothetical protein JO078_13205 [Candidatus Eremiobacteraeota bacterium]|nr:hypothetical protein [Candidatus Eremiobacteraeota bacterium]MBV9701061.1 hypothetical protein [Candidatus Eremiobacteraeota bacterium]